jgi:DegV family protein with EDD domain
MTVAVVTDSAAALPEDLAARWGVTVVPMWLTVGGQAELEGTRSLDALLEHPEVLTAAPTPGEFAAAIGRCLDRVDEVVVCTMAKSMSATNEAARIGSAVFDGAVSVVDSRSAAGGQALVVLAAARAAAAGGSGEAVADEAQRVAARVRLVASLPSLDHLVRGGRVPGIAGWAGKRLGINPLFEFRDGTVRRLRPALSPDAAAERMLAQVTRSAPVGGRLHVVALHALARPVAAALLERVADQATVEEAFVGAFGPVMVVHTGPGLTGVAWWWDDDPR